MAKPRVQSGFTLVELLIAMAVAAVLAVLSYQAVDEVVSVQRASEENIERFQQVQKAIWWLEQDLTQLTPRPVNDGFGGELPACEYISGQGLEMTRIAIYPSPYGVSGLVRVRYQLEGSVLYRIVWSVVDRAPDSQPIRLPILDKVTFFEVRMLNAERQWQTSWPGNSDRYLVELPLLTDVRLELEDLGRIRRLLPGVDGMPEDTKKTADNGNGN